MILCSWERRKLAQFIQLYSRKEREAALNAAIKDPMVSGPLIRAYRWAIENT